VLYQSYDLFKQNATFNYPPGSYLGEWNIHSQFSVVLEILKLRQNIQLDLHKEEREGERTNSLFFAPGLARE